MDKVFYRKVRLVVGGLIVITLASTFSTLTLMYDKTEPKVNEFSPFTITDTETEETEYTVEEKDDKFVIKNKNIKVVNPSSNISKAVYARVLVVVTPADIQTGDEADKENVAYIHRYNDGDILSDYTLGDGWVKGKDGFYYYCYVIRPGETTTSLFVNGDIILNTNIPCNIEVITDTVQAEATDNIGVYTKKFIAQAWGSNIPTEITTITNT